MDTGLNLVEHLHVLKLVPYVLTTAYKNLEPTAITLEVSGYVYFFEINAVHNYYLYVYNNIPRGTIRMIVLNLVLSKARKCPFVLRNKYYRMIHVVVNLAQIVSHATAV